MSGTPVARDIVRLAAGETALPTVTLDHAARFLRRKRLVTEAGWGFLVDLAQTTSVEDGDAFVLTDGAQVRIVAAPEALLEVTGADLVRLAWHIGNRHCPCQIGADRLVIKHDPVLARMLDRLGAEVRPIVAPFRPEGGAYGHGRTQGHDHGSGHRHDPAHGHGSADEPFPDPRPDETDGHGHPPDGSRK